MPKRDPQSKALRIMLASQARLIFHARSKRITVFARAVLVNHHLPLSVAEVLSL